MTGLTLLRHEQRTPALTTGTGTDTDAKPYGGLRPAESDLPTVAILRLLLHYPVMVIVPVPGPKEVRSAMTLLVGWSLPCGSAQRLSVHIVSSFDPVPFYETRPPPPRPPFSVADGIDDGAIGCRSQNVKPIMGIVPLYEDDLGCGRITRDCCHCTCISSVIRPLKRCGHVAKEDEKKGCPQLKRTSGSSPVRPRVTQRRRPRIRSAPTLLD